MTAPTTDTPVVAPTEPVKPAVVLDEFGQTLVNKLVPRINDYNAKCATLSAIGGDIPALMKSLADTTKDAAVVKLNADLEVVRQTEQKLITQRDGLLRPIAEKMQAESKDQVATLKADADALLKTIKNGQNYLKSEVGEEALTLLPKLKGQANRSASSGDGETSRRIRGFDYYVNDVLSTARDQKGVDRSNLATVSKEVGASTAALQEAFFAVAGKDANAYPDKVEFEVKGKDDKVYHIKAIKVAEGAKTA